MSQKKNLRPSNYTKNQIHQIHTLVQEGPLDFEEIHEIWNLDSRKELKTLLEGELSQFCTKKDEYLYPTEDARQFIESVTYSVDNSDSSSNSIENNQQDTTDQHGDHSETKVKKVAEELDLTDKVATRLLELKSRGPVSPHKLAEYWGLDTPSEASEYVQDNLEGYYGFTNTGSLKLVDKAVEDIEQAIGEGFPDSDTIGPTDLNHLQKLVLHAISDGGKTYERAIVEDIKSGSDENIATSEVEAALNDLVEYGLVENHPNFSLSQSYSMTRKGIDLSNSLEEDFPARDEMAAGEHLPVYSNSGRIPISKLIDEISSIAADLGHPPSEDEILRDSTYPLGAYLFQFGTLAKAIKSAGLPIEDQPPNDNQNREYTNVQFLSSLQIVADILGEVPRSPEFDMLAPMSNGLSGRFNGWEASLEAAGLSPSDMRESHASGGYSAEEIREEIEEVSDSLGRAPTTAEVAHQTEVSPGRAMKEFGSWDASLAAAGIESTNGDDLPLPTGGSEATRRIIAILEEDLGHDFQYSMFIDSLSEINPQLLDSVVREETEIWCEGSSQNENIQTEPVQEKMKERSTTTNPSAVSTDSDGEVSLRDELYRLHRELGHPPRPLDIENYARYSSSDYTEEFGPWDSVLSTVGMDVNEAWEHPDDYDDALMQSFLDLEDMLGHELSRRNMDEIGEYSSTTYIARFGGWEKAKEKISEE